MGNRRERRTEKARQRRGPGKQEKELRIYETMIFPEGEELGAKGNDNAP